MQRYGLVTLLSTLFVIVFGGTVFFHYAEGWSWLDAYFFTVVTLSTVGYGNLVPATAVGKIGTTVLIFVGLGVFALTIQQVAAYTVHKREKHPRWLQASLWERPGRDDAGAEDSSDTRELNQGPRP